MAGRPAIRSSLLSIQDKEQLRVNVTRSCELMLGRQLSKHGLCQGSSAVQHVLRMRNLAPEWLAEI